MARIKYGSGVAEIRGSINGVVFSRNANGAYARNRTKGVNPNTLKQRNQRNFFGAVSRQWQQLGDAERSSFVQQASNYPYKNKLGETQAYTGFQLFQKVNAKLFGIDNTLFVSTMVPPVSLTSSVIADNGVITSIVNNNLFVKMEFLEGGQAVSFIVPADCVVSIEFSPSVSSGKYRPKSNAFRKCTIIDEGVSTDVNNLWTSYSTLNGTPVSGQFAWVRCQLVSKLTAQVGAYTFAQIAW